MKKAIISSLNYVEPFADKIAYALLAFLLIFSFAHAKAPRPEGDQVHYLTSAYNIFFNGVHSSDYAKNPKPDDYREPLYSFVIAGMMAIDHDLRDNITLLLGKKKNKPEEGKIVESLRILNYSLIFLSGLLFWSISKNITSHKGIALLGLVFFTYVMQRESNMSDYVVSDNLALFLMLSVSYLLIRYFTKNDSRYVLGAGFVFGLLILTKALFWYLLLIITVIGIFAFIVSPLLKSQYRKSRLLLHFSIAAFISLSPWLWHNYKHFGHIEISHGRQAMVLASRVGFNDISPQEYTAYLFDMVGPGKSLPKKWFGDQVYDNLHYSNPKGFYSRYAVTWENDVKKLKRQGLTIRQAHDVLMDHYKQMIKDNFVKHLLVSVPLFFNGGLIDPLFMLSFPCLVVLLFAMIRTKNWPILIIYVPMIYLMTFSPLISVNVPRYQFPSVPYLSLAMAIVCMMWVKLKPKNGLLSQKS